MNEKKTRELQVEVSSSGKGVPKNNSYGGGAATAVATIANLPAELVVAAVSETVEMIGAAITPREGGPESCEVKFGLKVGASGGVILAKMDSEVNLEIKVVWKRESPKTADTKPIGAAVADQMISASENKR